jgi:hypothetical protein
MRFPRARQAVLVAPLCAAMVAAVMLSSAAPTAVRVGSPTPPAEVAALAAAATKVASVHTTASFAMPAPGMTVVQSIVLGPGAWTVMAKASAINFSTSDFVRCEILDFTDNIALDSATYSVGSGTTAGGVITDLATLSVPTGTSTKVEQLCGHDSAAGNSAYLDPEASLVGFIAQGGLASNLAAARTSGSTTLTGTPTTLLSLALPVGNYAVGFKYTAVAFDGPASAACGLQDEPGFNSAAIATVGPGGPSAATSASFGYTQIAGGTFSIQLQCWDYVGGGRTSTAYLDPSVVLWARKVTSVSGVREGCGATLIASGTSDLVVMRRAFSTCLVSPGYPTRLSAAPIAKGNWVAVGGESDLRPSSGGDFARCELRDSAGHVNSTATGDVPLVDASITLLATIKSAYPTQVYESCSRDSTTDTLTSYDGSLVLIRP